jgi:hypothetical protein
MKLVSSREKYLSYPEFQWINSTLNNGSTDGTIGTMSDLSSRILANHSKLKIVKTPHTRTGGVLPVCIDPNTGISYFLFGLNFRDEYCHFHGWVEPNETVQMGAAREGYEESKGVFGSAADLWRALMSPFFHFQHGAMFFISLGSMNSEQREGVMDSFHHVEPTCRGMLEIQSIKFIPTRHIKETCLGAQYPAALEDGHTMRSFLLGGGGWLSSADLWASPSVRSLTGLTGLTSIDGSEGECECEWPLITDTDTITDANTDTCNDLDQGEKGEKGQLQRLRSVFELEPLSNAETGALVAEMLARVHGMV